MHQPIKDGLEAYLRGVSDHSFEAHLESCEECRADVEQMQKQSVAFQALRAPREFDPPSGFYARVMAQIDVQRKPPSFWSLFLDPSFGKRLAYASLTLLVLLGTYLISTEPGGNTAIANAPSSPEVILANQDAQPSLGTNQQSDRDAILVNLSTFHE